MHSQQPTPPVSIARPVNGTAMVRRRFWLVWLCMVALLSLSACYEAKVRITDVGAAFNIAAVTWFEEERTLFIFYQVTSEQGLSEHSRIELTYRTDSIDQPFVELGRLAKVHEHVAASCGRHTLCGSYSIRVDELPRDVGLQLRYHKDGDLLLPAQVDYSVVMTGTPYDNRSAVVYGVFTEDNTSVQWRLRHQFPTIRNEQAQALGLRRQFDVRNIRSGSLTTDERATLAVNPYGYGLWSACPNTFSTLSFDAVETNARAIFQPEALPLETSADEVACGAARVRIAGATLTTAAIAQKNPEVRAAFPVLDTHLSTLRPIKYFFETCDDIVSASHRSMQIQRLFLDDGLDGVTRECVDDVSSPAFAAELAERFLARIDSERLGEGDMILVMGLNRPDDRADVAIAIDDALALVMASEATAVAPRLVGAFVYDSAAYSISNAATSRRVLWCPANSGGDLDEASDTSATQCAVVPDSELDLQRLRITSLPILPSRRQYTKFVDNYSEAQTGSVTDLRFRAPSYTAVSQHFELDDFGVLTFFNNEAITPAPGDAFSYCATDDPGYVALLPSTDAVLLPLSVLPAFQAQSPAARYSLGLIWDFPFLLRLKYESVLAGAIASSGLHVPFGIASPAKAELGSAIWDQTQIDLSEVLLQCTRFCTHPTFDSAGVYNIRNLFSSSYAERCYRPKFPTPADGGFPSDP